MGQIELFEIMFKVILNYNDILEVGRGLMVIVVRNKHSDMSSNPGRDCLNFHITFIPLKKYESSYG